MYEHLLFSLLPHHSSLLLFPLIFIHFIVSHSSIRHRTLLLISFHSLPSTPSQLPSVILSYFPYSFHFILSTYFLEYSSLATPLPSYSSSYSFLLHRLLIALSILFIHSLPHHSIPFSSHPILLPSPLQNRPISFLILSILLCYAL